MNTIREYRPAVFIIGAALLGAAAVILVPGLFDDFGTPRLVAVLALTSGAVCSAVAALRNRRAGTQ